MPSPIDDGRVSAVESRAATLEAQVSYLSTRMDRVEGKLDTLSDRVTRLEERLAHLPTKEQVVKIALGALAAVTAIIAFQTKIQSFLGLGPPH